MKIEYATQCTDGGITISLKVEPGSAAKVLTPQTSKKTAAPAGDADVKLGASLNQSKEGGNPAEVDPTDTGTGGVSQLVIIFGPVVLGCVKPGDLRPADVSTTSSDS